MFLRWSNHLVWFFLDFWCSSCYKLRKNFFGVLEKIKVCFYPTRCIRARSLCQISLRWLPFLRQLFVKMRKSLSLRLFRSISFCRLLAFGTNKNWFRFWRTVEWDLPLQVIARTAYYRDKPCLPNQHHYSDQVSHDNCDSGNSISQQKNIFSSYILFPYPVILNTQIIPSTIFRILEIPRNDMNMYRYRVIRFSEPFCKRGTDYPRAPHTSRIAVRETRGCQRSSVIP